MGEFTTRHFFVINPGGIGVPVDYVDGAPISGSITFNGETLSSLGVNTSGGPYAWTLDDGQKIALTFGPDTGVSSASIKKKIKKLKKS